MKTLAIISLAAFLIFLGCSEDENMTTNPPPGTSTLTLNISGLADLGANAKYEGWIIVPTASKTDGTLEDVPKSTGVFTVDANGQLSKTTFEIDANDLANATKFILTIEPNPDSDPNPSAVHILAGSFNSSMADLSTGDGAALGVDFSNSTGAYILATPTNGANTDENSGIWFLDLSSGSPMQGLNLPTLPNGWKYEGWTVINGTPVTTGTFTSATVVDDADPYSSTMPGPPFPGEDFLLNAPSGLSFPTDIAGGVAVISIEPSPDNSSAPFLLKPLVGMIPSNATDHVTYMMDKNLSSFPVGSAKR